MWREIVVCVAGKYKETQIANVWRKLQPTVSPIFKQVQSPLANTFSISMECMAFNGDSEGTHLRPISFHCVNDVSIDVQMDVDPCHIRVEEAAG